VNIEQMRARLAEISTELRGINEAAGDSSLTAEAQTRWDALEAETSEVRKQIEAYERRQETLRSLAADEKNHVPGDIRTAPSVKREARTFKGGESVRDLSHVEARDMALRAMESANEIAELSTAAQADLERKVRKHTDIARRLLVTENDEYRNAFVKLVTRPTPVLTPEESRAILAFEEYRAMADGTGSAGGYGIPVLIDPSIILTTQGAHNPFLQVARQVEIQTNAWKGVSSQGVSWTFGAEASAASDNSPALAQPVVNVYRADGFIPYSIEVGQDYPDFATEMATLLDAGYSDLLLNKFSNGAGVGSN
jgi:HK97 family phage major capsid protein